MYETISQWLTLVLVNELFPVLLMLSLNLHSEDLVFRFGLSLSKMSQIIHKWVDIMYARLNVFIRWSEREVVSKTLPEAFEKQYPKACSITDCSDDFTKLQVLIKAQLHYISF